MSAPRPRKKKIVRKKFAQQKQLEKSDTVPEPVPSIGEVTELKSGGIAFTSFSNVKPLNIVADDDALTETKRGSQKEKEGS